MHSCLIAFGANISGPRGCPEETLKFAMSKLENNSVKKVKQSGFYSSDSFPDKTKPRYLNGCVEVLCDCDPVELLSSLKNIEKISGRLPGSRWNSRVCDLDILAFEDKIYPSKKTFEYWSRLSFKDQLVEKPAELILPHPRIQDRPFVLIPILEISVDWIHPVFKLTASEMLRNFSQHELMNVSLFNN